MHICIRYILLRWVFFGKVFINEYQKLITNINIGKEFLILIYKLFVSVSLLNGVLNYIILRFLCCCLLLLVSIVSLGWYVRLIIKPVSGNAFSYLGLLLLKIKCLLYMLLKHDWLYWLWYSLCDWFYIYIQMAVAWFWKQTEFFSSEIECHIKEIYSFMP